MSICSDKIFDVKEVNGVSDVVISGYYGLGNSGDEALLKTIVADLKKEAPGITITALSGNKKQTRESFGIKTVNRYNPFTVCREICGAKLLISGGGTLIQDATSTKSLLYYLSIIRLAHFFKTRVMLYANGIGPIKNKNERRVGRALNLADVITLREDESVKELERCAVTKPKVFVTADPAFNLAPSDSRRTDELMKRFKIPHDRRLIAVSVRAWSGLKKDFEEKMAKSMDYISDKGYFPVFMPMQMSKDLEISVRISKLMKNGSAVVKCDVELEDLLGLIGRCSAACGMRLHMLIFAGVMAKPMAGVVYDPKIKGFMDYMGQKYYVPADEFDENKFNEILNIITDNKDKLSTVLAARREELRIKAAENAKIAAMLINGKKKCN